MISLLGMGSHDHRAGTAVPFAVVVGRWQPIAHGQQKALTVATKAKREHNSRCVGHNGLFSSPPNRSPLGDSGERLGAGELRGGESHVWLFSKHFLAQSMIFAIEPSRPPHPDPLPQHKNVLEEREQILGMLTLGGTSNSCRWCHQGYNLMPRWGSMRKKPPPAASQNVQYPDAHFRGSDFSMGLNRKLKVTSLPRKRESSGSAAR